MSGNSREKNQRILHPICPMFGTPCRHCSEESTQRIYSEFDRDPRTELSRPVRQGKLRIGLGAFCNDAGEWISDMHYCPVIWGNSLLKGYANHTETKKTNPKNEDRRKTRWKIRKDGNLRKTPEILHLGQQTLLISQR